MSYQSSLTFMLTVCQILMKVLSNPKTIYKVGTIFILSF